jgi:hypothetical protein
MSFDKLMKEGTLENITREIKVNGQPMEIKEESNTDRHLRHMKPIQKAQKKTFIAKALTENKSGTIKKQGELF